MVNFKEIYHFSRFQRGPTFTRGVQLFSGEGGGGSNCLFPIETHITCDFPGGSGLAAPPPPLDPHLSLSDFSIIFIGCVFFSLESHLTGEPCDYFILLLIVAQNCDLACMLALSGVNKSVFGINR